MTYFRVKNQFLLQRESAHLRQGRGGEAAWGRSISENQERAKGTLAKETQWAFAGRVFMYLATYRSWERRWTLGSVFSSISAPQRLHYFPIAIVNQHSLVLHANIPVLPYSLEITNQTWDSLN